MHNGAPIHVERPLPDTPEMFRYVADLVKSCCDSYVIGLTSAMRRYSSGMDYVIVNGTPVIANGEHTGARSGKTLRHLPKK